MVSVVSYGSRMLNASGLETALNQAGTNRTELGAALKEAPETQREGMQFLIENMPERDLKSLSARYLLENAALAYEGFNKAPWRDRVPSEVFLNDVLPYASVDESRDDWRQRLYKMAAPLIADCKSPGEAAQRLNQKLFPMTGVRYSTERHRANQGPNETLETKIATCTGLSILLVDACRAVGIPARVAGTPLWANGRGNHTWIEIWDGDWKFTGASEPDPAGLNRGWFVHDASQAIKDDPKHAIYATSFAKTGLSFPLVWARNVHYVSAVNVTDRYTPNKPTAETNTVRLLVKVLDRPAGKRVAAKVRITSTNRPTSKWEGVSRDESVDLNDILPFKLAPGSYEVHVENNGREIVKPYRSGTNTQDVVVVTLSDSPLLSFASQVCYAPPKAGTPLKEKEEARLKKALADYFKAPAQQQAEWKFPSAWEKLLRKDESAVRQAAWEAYKEAPIHESAKADFATNQVKFEKYLSPYTVKQVGTRPANGWALFIAMHGGGNAPKAVNDSQWKHMQIYYREHPEVGGYLYLALRAPNDTWNGFYDVYVYPLIANLINQFLLFGDVDPNKVFIMGYSHGGYGAYAIGPKMPDRFAAIHASAAAATDGESTPKTLRNTRFTVMVGDKDTMYGRYERNLKFRAALEELRGNRQDIYPGAIQIIEGNGHTGLPDRDKIAEMYSAIRNPVPTELTWLMTDNVITDFYWLRCATPAKQLEIDATCRDNKLTVTTTGTVTNATIFLSRALVDFDKPLNIELNGRPLKPVKIRPSLRVLCETLARRGDPDLAFTARLDVVPVENTVIRSD
jgi:poly(3-hydroxybutyrate) depolymerase